MTSTDQNRQTGALDPTTQQFSLWCLEAFGLGVDRESDLVFSLSVPRQPDGTFEPRFASAEPFDGCRFTFELADQPGDKRRNSAERMTIRSELGALDRESIADGTVADACNGGATAK